MGFFCEQNELTPKVLVSLGEQVEKGTTAGIIDRMIAFEEVNKLIGLPEIRNIEMRCATDRTTHIDEGK